MHNDIIERLKQFEVILKKCILDRFGTNLSQNKIDLLNNTSFVNDTIMSGLSTGNQVQGRILRNMLYSIINFKCNKNFVLKDGNTINVLYGEDLEKEVIEFYATDIAQKYKFNIDFTSLSLDKVSSLKTALGDTFDFSVLNLNADVILDNPNLALFTTNYNDEILKKYQTDNNVQSNDDIEIIDLSSSSAETSDVLNNYETESEEESILSDEEYQNLCIKYARNEQLTQEEFNKLVKSTPELLSNNDVNEFSGHNVSVISNEETTSRMGLGFTSPSLALYIFSIFAILLICLGIILF